MSEYEGLSAWNSLNVSISLADAKKATSKLTKRKTAGPDGIMAEQIKHGGIVLLIHLTVVFQAMLKHAFVPNQFREAIMVPILKNRNGCVSDPKTTEGYRCHL